MGRECHKVRVTFFLSYTVHVDVLYRIFTCHYHLMSQSHGTSWKDIVGHAQEVPRILRWIFRWWREAVAAALSLHPTSRLLSHGLLYPLHPRYRPPPALELLHHCLWGEGEGGRGDIDQPIYPTSHSTTVGSKTHHFMPQGLHGFIISAWSSYMYMYI